MKRYFVIALLLISFSAHGFDMEGIWKEDISKTIYWNETNRKIDTDYLEKLEALSGHMFMLYSDGIYCQFHVPYTLEYDGVTAAVLKLQTEVADYRIIGENEFGVILEFEYPDSKKYFDMFIFEGETSMYVKRMTTEEFGQPGHRTYFMKTSDITVDPECHR